MALQMRHRGFPLVDPGHPSAFGFPVTRNPVFSRYLLSRRTHTHTHARVRFCRLVLSPITSRLIGNWCLLAQFGLSKTESSANQGVKSVGNRS